MADVAGCVAAGMALLEKRRPGAAAEIDLPWLDISDCEECVLGQLYGRYARGLAELGLSERDAIEMGFTYAGGDALSGEIADAKFAALTAEWRRVITERLEASRG